MSKATNSPALSLATAQAWSPVIFLHFCLTMLPFPGGWPSPAGRENLRAPVSLCPLLLLCGLPAKSAKSTQGFYYLRVYVFKVYVLILKETEIA